MTIEITDEELRAGGFTPDARNYPRSRRQLEMIAAWSNTTVDKLPKAAHFFPNPNMRDAWERVEAAAQKFHNANPPTVCVGLVWVGDECNGGLLVGRRALPGPGFGKLALIGGYQDMGEDWRACISREMQEEAGLQLDASRWETWGSPQSVENGTKNLQFCYYKFVYPDSHAKLAKNDIDISGFKPNAEISELMVWYPELGEEKAERDGTIDRWAFSVHRDVAYRYYHATLR